MRFFALESDLDRKFEDLDRKFEEVLIFMSDPVWVQLHVAASVDRWIWMLDD